MRIKLQAPWWGWLLLLVGLTIFIRLGVWQWHRADQKAQMLSAFEEQGKTPVQLTSQAKIKQYQPLRVMGKYDNSHIFLLDNRFYQHRFGYDVLTPFQVYENKYILVDRGWVEGAPNRQNLPAVELATKSENISGTAYYPSSKVWTLGAAIENQHQWPMVVEKIDFKAIEKILGVTLYPFILRLDRADPNAFVRDWRVVTMLPAQHRGYAFQWFGFAAAALIIFIVLSLRQNRAAR